MLINIFKFKVLIKQINNDNTNIEYLLNKKQF